MDRCIRSSLLPPPASRVALLLELLKISSLAGAAEKVLLQRPADDVQQHGALCIDRGRLVGLPVENVKHGLVDRA